MRLKKKSKINKSNKEVKLKTSKSYIDLLEKILEDENVASRHNEIENILDGLIKTRNGTDILRAGRMLNGLFVEKIEDALIDLEEPLFLYGLAKNVKNVNISRIEDEMVRIGDYYFYAKFAEEIESCDVAKFEDELIKLKDYHLLAYFANHTTKVNISRIEDMLIEEGNVSCLCGFARLVNKVNVKKIEDAIINFGHASYMLTLAKEVENADRERLEQAVIKAESPVTSLSWVTSFDTKRFNEHLDIIVDIGTFSQCYSMYSQFYDCLAPYKKELLLFALHAKAQSPFELIQLSKVNQDDRIK